MARKAVLTILMLCIFGLFGFAQVVDLAVTKVEALGVGQKTARLVEDVLQSQLATQPLLRLVERNHLDALLQEQELQLSGITSAESAARADFLYPTYYLLSTAAGYSYWKSTDSSVIGYGIVPEIAYEGRRFFFRLAIPLIYDPISIRFTYQYRPLVWQHWSAGIGPHVWQVLTAEGGASIPVEEPWSPSAS